MIAEIENILADLEWTVAAGADEAVGDVPVDRFSVRSKPLAVPVPVPVATIPAASPEPVSDPAPSVVNAATLEELRDMMANFDCALKKTAQNLVFSDGNPSADLMIVGEAPGAEEDKTGLPFVGASGHLLDKMLASIGLDRTSVYISNVVPWRPPLNRKPSEAEIALLAPFIRRHIALAHPKVLLLLGGSSVSALLGIGEGITRARGKWYAYRDGQLEIPAFASFHPAFLLRSPAQKKAAWFDFLTIKRALSE
jgi:DNA polymerase